MDVSITIKVPTGSLQPLLMQTLTVFSNVEPFFVNSTDSVVDRQIVPGDNLEIRVPITIDQSIHKTYELLIVSTAHLPEGRECITTEFASLPIGSAFPDLFENVPASKHPLRDDDKEDALLYY